MLQFDIEGRSVLDLFAGSGQMGLEALSRGAAEAVFIDSSKDAIKLIEENAKKTKLTDNATIIQSNYIDFLKRNKNRKFDIVILDPPYALEMYRPALKELLEANMLKPTTLIVCESGTEEIFDNDQTLQNTFEVAKQSKYSKTFITVLALKEKDEK